MSFDHFRGLNILVVSPNEWGTMRVSKHHYATELARLGNRVFFLNPPDTSTSDRFKLQDVEGTPGLVTITYRPFLPFWIRFRSRHLFNLIARAHVHWILRRIPSRIDVVWCFDVNLYSDLRWFEAPLKIYHPVDQVVEPYQIDVGRTADLIVSVSEEILRKFRGSNVRILRVEHGLAAPFVALTETRAYDRAYASNRPLRVGYVGNLLMKYVDRATVLKIVEKHPEIDFHFWGPRTPVESNVSSADSLEAREFVRILELSKNVLLHGPLPSERLAEAIADMDAFLVCYDVAADPNRGCNSHKILEYLSTGRVVIANHISDYADRPDLIEMLPSAANALMPELFASVVCDIMNLNGREEQQARRAYALKNSYALQIERIENSLRSSVAEMAAAGATH